MKSEGEYKTMDMDTRNHIARIRDILEKWHSAKKEAEFGKKDIKPPANDYSIKCKHCGNRRWFRHTTMVSVDGVLVNRYTDGTTIPDHYECTQCHKLD